MAKWTFLKLAATLSLLMIPLALRSHTVLSTNIEDMEDEEEYVVDNPLSHFGSRTRSRFLTSIIKKGTRCDPITDNVCNGILANKGRGLLYCCKKHCRNVLSDKNNCGQCGHKCNHGERCCNGICTNLLHNVNHCGKCNRKCSVGVPCENGFCGYA